MKKNIAILSILLVSIIVAGCSSDGQTGSNEDTLKIYTTVYPIQYAVERVGGETVAVETVYPPGADAHTFEPTSKDMTSIADSDAFIYIGAGMEGFAESAAGALASQEVKLVEIGAHEELFHADENQAHEASHTEDDDDGHDDHDGHSHGDEDGHDDHDGHSHGDEDGHDDHDGHSHGDHDPHIWIDPLRMIKIADLVKDTLIELNPENESLYIENFESLEKDLLALDESYNNLLIDKEEKHILVSHAAFGYWEERYGIEQISINGLSSSSEPSQKDLTRIIDQAKEYGLDYIIFEQNSANRISEIIQSEIDAQTLMIHNLSVLTDEDIENGEDYMSLMEYNLEILDKATK